MNEQCEWIVTAAECVSSEILVDTWQEIEYRFVVCPAITGAHINTS